jgi:hypothetical protein
LFRYYEIVQCDSLQSLSLLLMKNPNGCLQQCLFKDALVQDSADLGPLALADIAKHIFSYMDLAIVRLVCKQWYNWSVSGFFPDTDVKIALPKMDFTMKTPPSLFMHPWDYGLEKLNCKWGMGEPPLAQSLGIICRLCK